MNKQTFWYSFLLLLCAMQLFCSEIENTLGNDDDYETITLEDATKIHTEFINSLNNELIKTARTTDDEEKIKRLINQGAQTFYKNPIDGNTALHTAILYGPGGKESHTRKYLIEKSQQTITNGEGKTVLQLLEEEKTASVDRHRWKRAMMDDSDLRS